MRKLTYKIVEETDRTQSIKWIEFITDRTPQWTRRKIFKK